MAAEEKETKGDKVAAKSDPTPEAAVEEGATHANPSGATLLDGTSGAIEEEDGIIGETPKVSTDDFFRRVKEKKKLPEYGNTPEAQMHWSRPRRWRVRLWDVRIENAIKDNNMFAFANFIFGGTREEYLVRPSGGSPKIWIAGNEGREMRTPVVQDVPGDGIAADLEFDEAFEWHGSYIDLEKQSLRVELWNWARYRVNKFDSFHEESLVGFAKGIILNEVECIKLNKLGQRKVRARIAFKLYFQEIYDFQLTFVSWRATGLRTCALTLEQLRHSAEVTGNRGSLASLASAASVAGPQVNQRVELLVPWLRSWCCCRRRGRRFMSHKAPNSSGSTDWARWDGTSISFRGTGAELNAAVFEATVFSSEKPKDLGQHKAPQGSRRAGIPLCTATVSLKGVLDHGELKAELVPAPWLYQVESGHRAHKHQSGVLHGNLLLEHQPRYQQREDLAGDLDLRKRYLFVHVIKVDRVVTPDTRPTDEIDSFVEVTFDGACQRTRVRNDDSAPHFDDELVFELALARTAAAGEAAGVAGGNEPDDQQLWEEIESKGPVHFDLWTQGPLSNDHLGSCEAFLNEILVNERGQLQKTVDKRAKSKHQREEEDFPVRVFRGMKPLSFIWGEGSASNLFFEMWFLPDLGKNARLKQVAKVSALPKSLENRFPHSQDKWQQKTSALCSEGRQFPCTLQNQFQDTSYFLPRFLDVVKPPRGVVTCNAISHYVGCIPYVSKTAPEPVAFTPDFFGRIKKGEALDHALLHASFLLGLQERAFVCLGSTVRREPHAWVMTLETDGAVKFWEPFLGTGCFTLQHRLAHPEFVLGPRNYKRLPEEAVSSEVDRRKRLRLQKGAPSNLVLRATKAHPHPLVYVNVSAPLDANTHCSGCRAIGGCSEFTRGFRCQKPECKYELCWKCAEEHWGDRATLNGLTFDPTEPYEFEGGASGSALPYRTVEVVFNNSNCWANLQHGDPRMIFWDLWNPMYWHAFTHRSSGLRPCFQSCRFVSDGRDEAWCAARRRQVLQHLQSALRMRRSLRNLETSWVRSPTLSAFLEAGLQLRERLEVCPPEKAEALREQLDDWQRLLEAKTPARHQFRCTPLHFGFCDPPLVAKTAVDLCGFAEAREKTTQFAVAVHLRPMPGEVVSLYLFICALHRLSDLEVQEEVGRRKLIPRGRIQSMIKQAIRDAQAEAPEPPPMSGFDEAFRSPFVKISSQATGESVATFSGKKSGAGGTRAGVMGNGPVPGSVEGKHFEVKVLKVNKGCHNSLTIGVTTRSPDSIAEVPASMDQVSPVWLAGFGGGIWDPKLGAWETAAWQPQSLAVEDRVACCVAPSGEVTIFVNDRKVVSWQGGVPQGKPLYAVVDLSGSVDAVALAEGVQPQTKGAQADTAPTKPHAAKLALAAQASALAQAAATKPQTSSVQADAAAPSKPHSAASALPAQAGPGANSPAQPAANRSQSVARVAAPSSAAAAEQPSAIATATKPPKAAKPKATNALAHPAAPKSQPVARGAEPSSGVAEATKPPQASTPKPSASTDAAETIAEEQALPAVAVPPPPRRASVPSSYSQALRMSTRRGSTTQASPRHSLRASVPRPSQSKTSLPKEALPLLQQSGDSDEEVPPTPGFSRDARGALVELSADGLSARHTGETGAELNGVLLGHELLQRFAAGHYFELRVDAVRVGVAEGLALGVTTVSPAELGQAPEQLETVQPCWLLGTDGAQWDGKARNWSPCEGARTQLETGDSLGVLVTPVGELRLIVNGVLVARGDFSVPCDQTLFAAVELTGATSSVTLLRGAQPPPEASATTPLWVAQPPPEPPPSATPQALPAPTIVTPVAVPQHGKTAHAEPPGQAPTPRPLPEASAGYGKTPLTAAKPSAPPSDAVVLEKEMRGFHRSRLGSLVALSAEGRVASRARNASGDANCVLIGDGPLRWEENGGVAFAISVAGVREGAEGGLALGVTTRRPGDFAEMPETADQVSPSWLVGYDAATWDGTAASWGFCHWNPSGLKVGDRLQLRISSQGEMQVSVNWVQQAVHRMEIPPKTQLFALVDLQGCTSSVSLLTREELDHGRGAPMPPATMQSFSQTVVGRSVLLSPDALTATRKGGATAGSEGILMGDGVLEAYADGTLSFALSVTAVNGGSEEGLLVGVTSRSPAEFGQPPSSADQVDPCWLVGCDGACWNGNTKQWGYSDWDPRTLAVGDVVLVSVTSQGDLCVSVNGLQRAAHRMQIPVPGSGLFALVDLLGCTVGVALTSQHSVAKAAGSVGVGTAAQPKPPPAASAVPSSTMRGFHRTAIGRSLTLSQDQRTATRVAKSGARPRAVLLGDAPLERAADGGTCFTVSITVVSRSSTEGLAVGVTTRHPGEIGELPETADAVMPSWLVGYDGATWNGSAWGLSDWHPQQLEVGETVAVSTTQRGQLRVSVNGARVCSHDLGIPPNLPLYAMLDLAGHTAGVALLQPPPAEGRSGQGRQSPAQLPVPARPAAKSPTPSFSSRAGSPDTREPKRVKEAKGPKEDRAPKEPKEERAPKEPREHKAHKEPKEYKLPKEKKKHNELKEPKEYKDPRERKERRERQRPPD